MKFSEYLLEQVSLDEAEKIYEFIQNRSKWLGLALGLLTLIGGIGAKISSDDAPSKFDSNYSEMMQTIKYNPKTIIRKMISDYLKMIGQEGLENKMVAKAETEWDGSGKEDPKDAALRIATKDIQEHFTKNKSEIQTKLKGDSEFGDIKFQNILAQLLVNLNDTAKSEGHFTK